MISTPVPLWQISELASILITTVTEVSIDLLQWHRGWLHPTYEVMCKTFHSDIYIEGVPLFKTLLMSWRSKCGIMTSSIKPCKSLHKCLPLIPRLTRSPFRSMRDRRHASRNITISTQWKFVQYWLHLELLERNDNLLQDKHQRLSLVDIHVSICL